ncbi:transposase [Lentzea sp. CC55]|nr:transposase [Lentzea sp. CC55]
MGKRGNCQIRGSVHAVTDWVSAAVDWRLLLLESWDDRKAAEEHTVEIARKRARCAIPPSPIAQVRAERHHLTRRIDGLRNEFELRG